MPENEDVKLEDTTTTRTLYMTFDMDNEKTHTISLADPYSSLASADVKPIMADIVNKQAFLAGTAVPEAVKSAYITEVKKNVLF